MHVKDKGMYKKDGINDCDQACATHVSIRMDIMYVLHTLVKDFSRSRRRLKFSSFGDESSRNFAIFLPSFFIYETCNMLSRSVTLKLYVRIILPRRHARLQK